MRGRILIAGAGLAGVVGTIAYVCLVECRRTGRARHFGEPGVVQPPVPVRPEDRAASARRRAWWDAARFGLLVHWGPYSQRGLEASLPLRAGDIPRDEYEGLARTFHPGSFDAAGLARLARQAGAGYVVFTAKHHDGYCMYDSRLTDYGVMHSPVGRDLTREIVVALRAEGLGVGLYFSLPDWHHPDYCEEDWPSDSGEHCNFADVPAGFARFVDYYQGQVAELLDRYAPDILWFDGDWHHSAAVWRSESLIRLVRGRAPDCLINDRCGLPAAADFAVLEYQPSLSLEQDEAHEMGRPLACLTLDALPGRHDPPSWRDPTLPDTGERCESIGPQWSWTPPPARLKSVGFLIRVLVRRAAAGGNYLLGIGLDGEGRVDPEVADRLREIGRWLACNGEGVYGTRPGPYVDLRAAGTHRDNCVYLHIFNVPPEGTLVTLPGQRLVRVRLLATGQPLPFGIQADGGAWFHVPAALADPYVTSVALDLRAE